VLTNANELLIHIYFIIFASASNITNDWEVSEHDVTRGDNSPFDKHIISS